MNEIEEARGPGWSRIGPGPAEIVAGREIGRTLGMEARAWLIRADEGRELVSGITIFSQDTPRAGVWSRVAGDVLDLATPVSRWPATATGISPRINSTAGRATTMGEDLRQERQVLFHAKIDARPVLLAG